MNPSDLATRVALLRRLADRADAIALTHFQRVDLRTMSKADATPVTEADLAIEAMVREELRRACPGDAILGEEHGEEHGKEHGEEHGEKLGKKDGEAARPGHFRWVIDPIDGTVGFSNGIPIFATLIGLEFENRVVAGACSMAALGERVWAARGMGATWERVGRAPVPARVRTGARLGEALICTTGVEYFEQSGTTDALLRVARAARRVRGIGDSYGGMLVATGRADGWFDPVMYPWDSGPFPVILAEAGGVFTDWHGREDIRGGSALAACPALHAELLKLVAR